MVLGAGGILLCWLFAPVPVSEQHSVSHEQMRDATVAILGSTSNDISSTLLSRASGVLITSDGIVLTTKHSVSGDVLYQVWTHEGEQYAVSQLWRDPQHDLAVLQIRRSDGLKPQKLSFLPLPDLQSATGAVQAIGYPYDHQELIMLTGSIV